MKKKLYTTAILIALASAVNAEDAWIKQPAVLRDDGSAAGQEISKMVKGDQGVVLERADGWVKVNFNGKVGWVSANSLSARPTKADTKLLGGNSSAEASGGAAGKGLEPIAADYANTHNLSTAGLDQMVKFKKTISSQMLKDFVADGNIQRPAKRTATTQPAAH